MIFPHHCPLPPHIISLISSPNLPIHPCALATLVSLLIPELTRQIPPQHIYTFFFHRRLALPILELHGIEIT